MLKRAIVLAAMAVVMLTAAVFAQDPGVADTVRLGNTTSTTVPVYIFNDEPISKITIPLLIDGYSGWAVYNSVSYTGSLLATPSVLDMRQVVVVETDTFSQAILLLEFEVGTGSSLPAGTGKLCDLVFTHRFGGAVALDTTTANGPVTLSITDGSAHTFVPRFIPGQITLSCDYGNPIGDLDENGFLGVDDAMRVMKYLYWHTGVPPSSLVMIDVNADRHADLKDAVYFLNYFFFAGPAPVSCGNYNVALYDDPGNRDTLFVTSKNMIVGIPGWVDFKLTNDEPIRDFAFALEWDGTASLSRPSSGCSSSCDAITARIVGNNIHGWECANHRNGVNPDTFHLAGLSTTKISIQPGFGPIFSSKFIPTSAGTATFRLVDYKPAADGSLTPIVESMMVDTLGYAIRPFFVSGTITVLPRPCGDADFNGIVTISDAVYLINYIFSSGPAPNPLLSGDADCNGIVTNSDPVYLINFIFSGGPAPCAACP